MYIEQFSRINVSKQALNNSHHKKDSNSEIYILRHNPPISDISKAPWPSKSTRQEHGMDVVG